jgi:hypothetical protein
LPGAGKLRVSYCVVVDVDVDIDADVVLLEARMVDEKSLVVAAIGRVADAAMARKPETPIGIEESEAEEKRRSMMVMEGAKLSSFIPGFCVAREDSEDSCVSMGCPVK